MIYYALVDISTMSDDDADVLREKIKKHFAVGATLKRKESVAAKALLCLLLKEKYNVTDFTVDCGEKGKPFIVDSNIRFNLSHSGSFVLCAFGDERVGCDIQEIKPFNVKVAKRFFAEKELDELEKSSQKALDFTRLWTLKESALKFSGEGVSGGLDRYDFSGYYKNGEFILERLHFNSFEIPGYVVSICSENGRISQLNADIKDITNKDF